MDTRALASGIGIGAAAALIAGVVAVSSQAQPAAPAATSATSTVKACANKKSGSMRLLTGGKCRKKERRVTWNVAGPKGSTGANGTTGATGARGQAGAKGDRGAQGARGARGEQGPAGVDGTAFLYVTVAYDGSEAGASKNVNQITKLGTGQYCIWPASSLYVVHTAAVASVTDSVMFAQVTPGACGSTTGYLVSIYDLGGGAEDAGFSLVVG